MADTWVPNWTVRRFTDPKSMLANANMVGCAHTIVGSYSSGWNFGNVDGNPYAQSYIRGSGEGVNAWPVNLRGAANLEGNPYVWAIETEDVNPLYFPSWNLKCGEVPAWTDAQVETLTEGLAWWCIRYRRPAALIPDTKPGRVGLAYHRQGVPDSPEWVTGADEWTKHAGKCCPDWRRIHQFKTEVIPGVASIVNQEDDPLSALTDSEQKELLTKIRQVAIANTPFHQDANPADERFQVQKLVERLFVRPQDGEDTVRKALLSLARRGTNDAATSKGDALQVRLAEIEAKLDQLLAPQ